MRRVRNRVAQMGMRSCITGLHTRHRYILAVLIVCALMSRLPRLMWGVPTNVYQSYFHPDEDKMWKSITRFPGIYTRQERFIYGTSLQYVTGLATWPIRTYIRQSRGFESDDEINVAIVAFRLLNVVLAVLGGLAVYALLVRFVSTSIAFAVSGLFLLSPWYVYHGTVCTLDAPMTSLVAIGMYLCHRVFETSFRWRSLTLLAVVTGVLLSTKVTMVASLAVPAVLWFNAMRSKRERRDWAIRAAAFTLGIFLVVVVSAPHYLYSFGDWIDWLWYNRAAFNHIYRRDFGDRLFVYLEHGRVAFGYFLFGGFVIGLCCVRKAAAWRIGMAGFVGILACLHGDFILTRYVLPLLPGVCFVTALLVQRLAESNKGRYVSIALGCLTLIASVSHIYRGHVMCMHDPREVASRYLSKQLSPTDKYAIARRNPDVAQHAWRYPAMTFHEGASVGGMVEYVVHSHFEMRVMAPALSGKVADSYFDEEDRWHEPAGQNHWKQYPAPPPYMVRFYRALLSGKGPYRLTKVINPACGKPGWFEILAGVSGDKGDVDFCVENSMSLPAVYIYRRRESLTSSQLAAWRHAFQPPAVAVRDRPLFRLRGKRRNK